MAEYLPAKSEDWGYQDKTRLMVESSEDLEHNLSHVTITLQIQRSNGRGEYETKGRLTVGGNVITAFDKFQLQEYEKFVDGWTISLDVPHDSNGDLTLTINVAPEGTSSRFMVYNGGSYFNYLATASYTIELPHIDVGAVYIDNGTAVEKYLIYIDNGSGWEKYAAHIDNGSGWDRCG